MLASLAILLIGVGTLVILGCNVLGTGFFLRKPPRGEYAVGLLSAFVVLFVGCVFIALGSVLAVFVDDHATSVVRGARGWGHGALMVAVGIGIGIAAFLAFLAWCERGSAGGWTRILALVLCWLTGIVGPLLFSATLMLDLLMTPTSLKEQRTLLAGARWGCVLLVGLAAMGYLATGFALWPHVIYHFYRNKHRVASLVRIVKRLRLPRGFLLQELRKELDALPANAPISSLLVYFNDPTVMRNTDCRELLTQRVLAHTDLNGQLCTVMRTGSLRERWSGFEFVRTASPELLKAHENRWSEAVRLGIIHTAEDMDGTPMLMLDFDLKRNPPGYVKSLIGAAVRFRGSGHDEAINHALRLLASGADGLRNDKHKAKVAKILKRAGYPIPQPRIASA